VEKINNNAYRIDLQGEHHVSSTFNVCDLSPFDVGTLDVIRGRILFMEGRMM
jgi:hypothetical protein